MLRSMHQKQQFTLLNHSHSIRSMKLRLIPAIVAPLLLVTIIPTPVRAETLNARCLLQVNGSTYLDDLCNFTSDTDSDSFTDAKIQITCPDGVDASQESCYGYQQRVTRPGAFGVLFRESGVGRLCWNQKTSTHAQSCFDGLRRAGACWSNPNASTASGEIDDVKFCAWAL